MLWGSFGLVHIPVLMNSAIKNNDISFNMLHKKCGEKLEYIRFCPHCKEKVKNKVVIIPLILDIVNQLNNKDIRTIK